MAKSFALDELVWAKMKGYSPWPAKIFPPPDSKSSKTKTPQHFVYFFGTHNVAWIKDELIFRHSEKMLVNARHYKRVPRHFNKAVEEIIVESKKTKPDQKNLTKVIKQEILDSRSIPSTSTTSEEFPVQVKIENQIMKTECENGEISPENITIKAEPEDEIQIVATVTSRKPKISTKGVKKATPLKPKEHANTAVIKDIPKNFSSMSTSKTSKIEISKKEIIEEIKKTNTISKITKEKVTIDIPKKPKSCTKRADITPKTESPIEAMVTNDVTENFSSPSTSKGSNMKIADEKTKNLTKEREERKRPKRRTKRADITPKTESPTEAIVTNDVTENFSSPSTSKGSNMKIVDEKTKNLTKEREERKRPKRRTKRADITPKTESPTEAIVTNDVTENFSSPSTSKGSNMKIVDEKTKNLTKEREERKRPKRRTKRADITPKTKSPIEAMVTNDVTENFSSPSTFKGSNMKIADEKIVERSEKTKNLTKEKVKIGVKPKNLTKETVKNDTHLILKSLSESADKKEMPSKPRNIPSCGNIHCASFSPPKLGFLGLGSMGSMMVRKILDWDFDVTIWNRSLEKCNEFNEIGAAIAKTPRDLVLVCDIIFCCVSDSEAVKSIFYSKDGVMEGFSSWQSSLRTGQKCYVEMTTIEAAVSQELSEAICGAGGRYLEAPMFGSRQQLQNSALMIIAAGDQCLLNRCKTIFNAWSRRLCYQGSEVGVASNLMTIISIFCGVTYGALAESLALFERSGFNPALLMEAIVNGGLSCPLIHAKGHAMIQNSSVVDLPVRNLQRNLDMAMALSSKYDQPMQVTAAVNEVFKRANSMFSEEDVSAIYKCYKPE